MYTVKPDCTGATSFGELGDLVLSGAVDFVWDDNMQEIRFIFTSAVLADGTVLQLAINGDARKMDPPRRDSDRVAQKANSPSQGS